MLCVLLYSDVCLKRTKAEKGPLNPQICYCYLAQLKMDIFSCRGRILVLGMLNHSPMYRL